MRILGLTHNNSGCGYHRVMVPLSRMPKEYCLITDDGSDEVLSKGWDVVVISRMWDYSLLEQREKYGFKLVVDIDDHWSLDHFHVNFMNNTGTNYDVQIVRFMKAADLVTCTHDRLAERIYAYNKNVAILPNAIPYDDLQFNDEKSESDKVRFFWAGGLTHELDVKILKNPISKIYETPLAGKIKMVAGGYCDNNPTEWKIWNTMGRYFTDNFRLNHELIKVSPVYSYYEMFKECDVMMVPLKKTDFNSCKSNLKILEAAGKKAPVICSSVHPYLGFPEDLVNYAHEDKMWLHWMHRLTDSEQMRKEQGEALREYVDKHYNFREINLARRAVFNSLIQKKVVS